MILGNGNITQIFDNIHDGIYLVDRYRSITYWSMSAEKLTGFTSSEALGKKCSDFLKHIDLGGKSLCDSMCPAMASMSDGQPREAMLYALHKEGFRLPVASKVLSMQDPDGNIVGATVILGDVTPRFIQIKRIEEAQKLLRSAPAADLDNKREIEISLHLRFDEMERYSWPFGVLFFEVDGLREIFGRHGGNDGQRVLKMMALTLLSAIRSSDTVGRWAENTFIAIIGNVNEHQLNSVAERLRMLAEKSMINDAREPISTTVSIGAAVASQSDTVYTLLKRAEDLMRQSALDGGNRITIDAEV